MRKVPITFDEKVDARYVRGPRDQCWMWDGGLQQGRPAINLRHVTRYIFEREFGRIPEGHTLWRSDHTDDCPRGGVCRHLLCVNPYHLQLRPTTFGLQERDNEWAIDDTTRVSGYKKRRKKNGLARNPKDQPDAEVDG